MTQVLLDTSQPIAPSILKSANTPVIGRPRFNLDLSEVALPALSTITQVSADEIAARPVAEGQSLSSFAQFRRRFLALFDHKWDSPDVLKKGGVRVSPNKRVVLEEAPYRTISKHTVEQKRELKGIARQARYHNFSRYSTLYEFQVPIKGLPKDLEGLKLMHFTDIHFREGNSRPIDENYKLAKYCRENNIKADGALLTGDDISGHPDDLCSSALRSLDLVLNELDVRFRFRSTGNHDCYPGVSAYGAEADKEVSKRMGTIGVLDVTSKHITLNYKGADLHIVGMDDYTEGQPIPPVKAHEKLDGPSILLVHDLSAVRADCTSVDLILSGHTHWGEIRIPYVIDGVRFMKWRGFSDAYNKQVRGWDRLTNDTLSYVGPGSARHSVWSPLFTRPGPTLLHLTAS